MTGGRLLDGRALARELEGEVASRLAGVRAGDPDFPVPTLGLVAVDVHPGTRRFVALKERAFRRAGLAVRGRVLAPDADTATVRAAVVALAGEPGVHGLFLQYPLPDGVDGRACADAVPVSMDVDAASDAARRLLAAGREPFTPATPEAVVRLLDAAGRGPRPPGADPVTSGPAPPASGPVHDGPATTRGVDPTAPAASVPSAAPVTLVAGDPAVDDAVAILLRRRGLRVRLVDRDDPQLAREVGRATVLVTCAGRPAAVDGRWIADGAVVVDAGYHHADGRGDLDPEPDPGRLTAYAPARGGVGPVTVAVLMAHTVEAAVRSAAEASGPGTGRDAGAGRPRTERP